MSVLTLRQIGDPVLRTTSSLVKEPAEARIHKLIDDMYTTMDEAQGIGLAAPQVGVSLRIFTWDVEGSRGAVINPTLHLSGEPAFVPRATEDEESTVLREGCLSVSGGIHGPVNRYPHAVLNGRGQDGQTVHVEATGLLAACFQHEIDHLDGKLFLDRLTGEHKKHAYRALRDGSHV